MNVAESTDLSRVLQLQTSVPTAHSGKQESTTPSFKEVIAALHAFSAQGIQDVRALDAKVRGGAPLSFQEILSYQSLIGGFGLRVELLSKVAESASTTLRRLQNGQ